MHRDNENESTPTRRAALQSMVRVSAALTAVGATCSAFLAPNEARADGPCEGLSPDDPLYQLLKHAIETHDMEAALALYADASGLSDAAIAALAGISSDDLQRFAELREKFTAALDDHVGGLAIVIIEHCDI